MRIINWRRKWWLDYGGWPFWTASAVPNVGLSVIRVWHTLTMPQIYHTNTSAIIKPHWIRRMFFPRAFFVKTGYEFAARVLPCIMFTLPVGLFCRDSLSFVISYPYGVCPCVSVYFFASLFRIVLAWNFDRTDYARPIIILLLFCSTSLPDSNHTDN